MEMCTYLLRHDANVNHDLWDTASSDMLASVSLKVLGHIARVDWFGLLAEVFSSTHWGNNNKWENEKKTWVCFTQPHEKKYPFASDLKNSLIEFHKYVHSVKLSYRSLENKLRCFDILSKTKQPSFKFIYILYRCSWYSVWFLALLMLIRNERRDDIYDFRCSVLFFRFGVVAFELISFS